MFLIAATAMVAGPLTVAATWHLGPPGALICGSLAGSTAGFIAAVLGAYGRLLFDRRRHHHARRQPVQDLHHSA